MNMTSTIVLRAKPLPPELQAEHDRIMRHVATFINRRNAQIERHWTVMRAMGEGPYRPSVYAIKPRPIFTLDGA